MESNFWKVKIFSRCGVMCKHLMRFYKNLGFVAYGKYDNKHFLKMPKFTMQNPDEMLTLPKIASRKSMASLNPLNLSGFTAHDDRMRKAKANRVKGINVTLSDAQLRKYVNLFPK